jgi:hypothetical protein
MDTLLPTHLHQDARRANGIVGRAVTAGGGRGLSRRQVRRLGARLERFFLNHPEVFDAALLDDLTSHFTTKRGGHRAA